MNAQLSDIPTSSPLSSSPSVPALNRRQTDKIAHLPSSSTSKFILKKQQPNSNKTKELYHDDVIALTRLGWNLTSIAKHVSQIIFKPTTQTIFLVKAVIADTHSEPLSFADLLPHLPLNEFIDPAYLEEFRQSLLTLTDPTREKQPLSDYDVHILKILVLIGWKKRRVADLLQVSPTMISIYTADLIPWTYEELKQLLPTIFQSNNDSDSTTNNNTTTDSL